MKFKINTNEGGENMKFSAISPEADCSSVGVPIVGCFTWGV